MYYARFFDAGKKPVVPAVKSPGDQSVDSPAASVVSGGRLPNRLLVPVEKHPGRPETAGPRDNGAGS